MNELISILPVIWPWLILIAGQGAALAGRTVPGLFLLASFCLAAAITGVMTPAAIAVIALGLTGAAFLPRLQGPPALAGHLLLIIWCLSLGAHLVPGFHNPLVLDQVHAEPDSGSFSMYLNADKPLVFFAVLLAWPGMIRRQGPLKPAPLMFGLALLPLLFCLGLWADAVRPEIGLPPWWLIFALSNLFLTCLAEEAFFRGYLQSAMSSKLGPAAGIALASLLFGLAHLAGGVALVLFATLLGLSCGLGYYATGRLWVPVLMHFGFNFLHLALFTYPGPA